MQHSMHLPKHPIINEMKGNLVFLKQILKLTDETYPEILSVFHKLISTFLEQQGLVMRSYGGAILRQSESKDNPFRKRIR